MTITLEVPAEMESVLSAKAELFGLALPDYVFSLCEADIEDDCSLSVEEVAVVKERLAEIEAGDKGILFEDYKARVMAKRAARAARAGQLPDGNFA